MKRFELACLLTVLAAVVSLSSAQAQVDFQRYASPAGGNSGCTPSAPCNLEEALAVSSTGGIISCIDGGFIQNSIETHANLIVDCPGAVWTPGSSGPALTIDGTGA
jgi:hypothetical protein